MVVNRAMRLMMLEIVCFFMFFSLSAGCACFLYGAVFASNVVYQLS